MRKFSIHHPKTRGDINEWLYHKAIKQEDVIGLRYGFVESKTHIKLNNSNEFITKETGIYAVEETFDKRTIESNQRKESVILKISEDYWWNEVKRSIEVGASYNKRWNSFMSPQLQTLQNSPITTFSKEKVMADSTMKGYFKLGKNMLEDLRYGKTSIDQIFDVKKLAMQNAILNLFGAVHGTYSINLRFYYNPITSKLEPMAFDGNSGVKSSRYEHFLFLNEEKDSVYLKELAKALNKISKKEFVDKLINTHTTDIKNYEEELKIEFKNKLFHEDNIRSNQNILKQELLRIKAKYQLDNITINTLDSPLERQELKIPLINNWTKKDINITKQPQKFNGRSTYKLSRKDKTTASYINSNGINIDYGSSYQVTFRAKKSSQGNMFGLRIQGIYPNRADVVFDLNSGKIIGTNSLGYFQNEQATIKPLINGWFECTLSVTANTDKISVIFGPTDASKTKTSWEGKSNIVSNVFITEPKIQIIKPNL